MAGAILTLNAGSSTVKAALFTATPSPVRLLSVLVDTLPAAPILKLRAAGGEWQEAPVRAGLSPVQMVMQTIHEWQPDIAITAVGHRIVHGGKDYTQPVRISSEVMAALQRLAPLAPLHLPPEIACIEAVSATHPTLPQYACFDTSFHTTQPRLVTLFALPREYAEQGVIRYGFHGLSYEYIASILPPEVGKRVVVAHLGNGASMCAIKDGKSVATSMGFSALDGLMMGTRSGAIDPGVLLYLMEAKGMSARDVGKLLYKDSGLLGVSGISGDMRELEASSAPEANEAIELFCYRAACELGKLVMVLGGLDALVFTGGIGENSERVRAGILAYTPWLGAFTTWVLPTDEEAMIARHSARLLHEGVG